MEYQLVKVLTGPLQRSLLHSGYPGTTVCMYEQTLIFRRHKESRSHSPRWFSVKGCQGVLSFLGSVACGSGALLFPHPLSKSVLLSPKPSCFRVLQKSCPRLPCLFCVQTCSGVLCMKVSSRISTDYDAVIVPSPFQENQVS